MKVILTINPGSTSTKIGLFSYSDKIFEASVDSGDIPKYENVCDEFPHRRDAVSSALSIDTNIELTAVVGRGGPLKPLRGGVYKINEKMLTDLKNGTYSNHASNLGALLADYFGKKYNVPAFIIDPVTVDEFSDLARISGFPKIKRKSRSHALNIKATVRKLCDKHSWDILSCNFVVAHLGGGASVAAIIKGKIIDVNDGLLGMGPFSPERAGALPIGGILDLAFSGDYSKNELEKLFSKNSGLAGYLGTNDAKIIEERIETGDMKAKLIYDAMIYQISKEIGAMLSVCKYDVEAVIITGGLAHSNYIQNTLIENLQIFNLEFIPGENELEAMADGGFRAIEGKIEIRSYE